MIDKFYFDEVIVDLYFILDMVCWVVSWFNDVDLFFGYGIDNVWDEVVSLVF